VYINIRILEKLLQFITIKFQYNATIFIARNSFCTEIPYKIFCLLTITHCGEHGEKFVNPPDDIRLYSY